MLDWERDGFVARARKRARKALTAWGPEEDDRTDVQDLISDLFHLLDALDEEHSDSDLTDLIERARCNYEAEKEKEE